jgi:hypothetical protein
MDLDELARLFPAGSATVIKTEKSHYLQLSGWESPLDDAQAHQAAQTALTRMNAIAMIADEKFRPATIAGMTKKNAAGMLITYINASCHIQARAGLSASLTVKQADGTIVEDKSLTFGQLALPLADTNDPLERALLLYGGSEHTWRTLYMVLEAIEDSHGGQKGLIAENFLPAIKVEDFKATANSYLALGADARHGTTSSGIPVARMTLIEARALIRELLELWMKKLVKNAQRSKTVKVLSRG